MGDVPLTIARSAAENGTPLASGGAVITLTDSNVVLWIRVNIFTLLFPPGPVLMSLYQRCGRAWQKSKKTVDFPEAGESLAKRSAVEEQTARWPGGNGSHQQISLRRAKGDKLVRRGDDWKIAGRL